jgi:signal transduction histidine kinase
MKDIQQLQTEVNTLQEQLKELSNRLEESERFKSYFIARISNEIVNPFTAIITMSSQIAQAGQQDIEKVRSMAEHIHREALFLNFQLKNLFAAARIEAGELEKEIVTTTIDRLIESCISESLKNLPRQNVVIDHHNEIPENIDFVTDAEKLKLILCNLFDNAIKFSPESGKVEVLSKLDGNLLKVSVSNQGEKLSEEEIKMIFDRFSRVNQKIHSLNPGSGLGLSIAAEYAGLLDGQVRAEETSEGMCFELQLPHSEEKPQGYDMSGDELFFDDNDEQVL